MAAPPPGKNEIVGSCGPPLTTSTRCASPLPTAGVGWLVDAEVGDAPWAQAERVVPCSAISAGLAPGGDMRSRPASASSLSVMSGGIPSTLAAAPQLSRVRLAADPDALYPVWPVIVSLCLVANRSRLPAISGSWPTLKFALASGKNPYVPPCGTNLGPVARLASLLIGVGGLDWDSGSVLARASAYACWAASALVAGRPFVVWT